jgi:ABC-type nitrate/sulfonate/bicarbonate transport system permease component
MMDNVAIGFAVGTVLGAAIGFAAQHRNRGT